MDLRIDELARRVGTTSRNVRAYQAKGLLPPPVLRGRTGYYGEEHLRRLELIDDLQQRGFSLEAIRQTLETWAQGGDLSHLLGFHRVVTAPFSDEPSERLTADELLARFPEAAERPELVEQAVELGLLEPEDGDAFTVPSPLLLDAGAELVRAGIPLAEVLELVKAVRADVADIAHRFVDLVARHLLDPIHEGTATADQAAAATETVRRLRPVALEVVRPFLAQELRRAADEALAVRGQRLSASAGEAHPPQDAQPTDQGARP